MTTGLTPTGYVAPTVDEEVTDLNTQIRTAVSGALDLDPDQPLGQLVAIFAEKFAELGELGATVYNALNPNAADGALLANICALTGTLAQVATYSTALCTLTFSGACTVNAGAIVSVSGQPANTWVLVNTVVYAGPGAGSVAGCLFRASVTGPVTAPATFLSVIGTPTPGWTVVSNPADATPGQAADTDTSLREKRVLELAGQGSGDADAIRARLLEIPQMVQAFVFENDTLLTDATGLPGKSLRAVVWDGGAGIPDATIAQVIWNNKPSGILSFGANTAAVTDSAGNTQYVSFDRATQLTLYITCTVTPATGVTIGATQRAAVREALYNYALATFNLGVSVIDLPLRAAAIVPTVTVDVPTFTFDFHSTPTNTANLPVTGLQIATLATTNISVNGSFS